MYSMFSVWKWIRSIVWSDVLSRMYNLSARNSVFCIYNIIVDHALWWVQFGALHLLVLVNFSSANWTNESLIGAVRRTKTSGTTKTVVEPWFKNLTGPSMHNLGLLSTHLGRFSFFAGLMANRQASRPLYICSDRLCLMLCIAVWPNYNSQICIVP